jgi:flagellar M-ring protein FliF
MTLAQAYGLRVCRRQSALCKSPMNTFRILQSNLIALGPRRLIVLGLSLLSIVGLILVVSYSVSRPSMETLYTGLDTQDVGRIGGAMAEFGIVFDVSADGKSVQVPIGSAQRARMLLAERGLPKSPNAGYELFDTLGPLGLTSFMQEVTRVRALEGELARTIQLIDGIRASRVHLVLSDPSSLRRDQREATASVVINIASGDRAAIGQTVRHLVAAAVPSLKISQVTVMTTDGAILASSGDPSTGGANDLVGLERVVSGEIQEKIRTTLAPYLGLDNFRTSITVKLNTDRHQTNETRFDPDQKVEKSVRVTKETGSARDGGEGWQTTVEQNIPGTTAKSSSGKGSSQDNQRREELTSYEIGSKTVAVDSNGYVVDALSVAVVINRQSFTQSLGAGSSPDALAAQVQEIQSLVSTAAGLRSQRGDTVKVMLVDFQPASAQLEAASSVGIGEFIAARTNVLINAVTVLIVAAIVMLLGVRPATRMLLQVPPAVPQLEQRGDLRGQAAAGEGQSRELIDDLIDPGSADHSLHRALPAQDAKRRLEKLVKLDEEGAAGILRDWIREAGAQ